MKKIVAAAVLSFLAAASVASAQDNAACAVKSGADALLASASSKPINQSACK